MGDNLGGLEVPKPKGGSATAYSWPIMLAGVDTDGNPQLLACTKPVRATGTVSFSGNATENDTVLIGTVTYRFRDTLAAAYDVKIGASAAITLDNLKAAINATGTAGTEYFAGTLAHPLVEATTNTDTTQLVQARTIGAAGNLIATTDPVDTGTKISWGAVTLINGLYARLLVTASTTSALP